MLMLLLERSHKNFWRRPTLLCEFRGYFIGVCVKQKTKSGPRFFKPKAGAKPAKARVLEVDVERLSDEGRGIAFVGGKAAFVGGALPGERARIRVIDEKKNVLDAELVELLQAAPQRIEPGCVLFGRCGGCQMQMLDASAQIAHKQSVLTRLLQGVAANAMCDSPLAATPWHYRHRARLAVSDNGGHPCVGFKSASSHQVVAVASCPILDERLQPLLTKLPGWLAQLPQWRRIEELLIAVDADGKLALDWNAQRAFPRSDAEQLRALATADGVQCGAGAVLRYDVPGVRHAFDYSVRDFTQVNPAINEQLVARALEWLAPDANEDIADLFCGLGNFTIPLAQHSRSVTGIEISAAMVERARQSALRYDNAVFDALDLFERAAELPDRFDKVLLDPPRAGARAVCEWLAKSRRVQRIVYVSCNPQTLARDVDVLVAGGFEVKCYALVDMFPQTGHGEAIVQLCRAE